MLNPEGKECGSGWFPRSVVHFSQSRAFVHRDVIGFITLDFILRIIRAGVVRMSLVIGISCMHLNDLSANASCLRVPGHVIPDFEFFLHEQFVSGFGYPYGSAYYAAAPKESPWRLTSLPRRVR